MFTLKAIWVTMSAASAMACCWLPSCPSFMGASRSLLGTWHTEHTQSRDLAASLCLSSGGESRDPMAPTPSVGMNPTRASNTVRTAERERSMNSALPQVIIIIIIIIIVNIIIIIIIIVHIDWSLFLLLQEGCHNSGW